MFFYRQSYCSLRSTLVRRWTLVDVRLRSSTVQVVHALDTRDCWITTKHGGWRREPPQASFFELRGTSFVHLIIIPFAIIVALASRLTFIKSITIDFRVLSCDLRQLKRSCILGTARFIEEQTTIPGNHGIDRSHSATIQQSQKLSHFLLRL